MKIYGVHDDRTVKQLETCVAAEEGARGVLCADGHVGYSMPIGGVVAYKEFVSPSGVGYDIACGNMAVKTNIKAESLNLRELEKIADEIQSRISFGVGRANAEPVDDAPVFERIAHSAIIGQRGLLQAAMDQLGTVGSGNHYVDVFTDQSGTVWIGVHFGSRGFGHKTATGFMKIAQGGSWDEGKAEGEMDAPPLLLNINQPSGQDYIEAMQIAGEYAYAGREAVVAKVLSILGAKSLWGVHNHHNFAWKENHGGDDFWVVRKGATPAFPDQHGFVGGSMGDISVILKGVDSPEAKEALYSTVHGAGRLMSRTQAAGKKRRISRWKCQDYRKCSYTAAKGGYHKDEGGPTPKCPDCGHKLKLAPMVEQIKPGCIDWLNEQLKVFDKGTVLRGAGADEAPPVYRKLQTVLDAHKESIRVIYTLKPLIVVMAGADVYDPYKD